MAPLPQLAGTEFLTAKQAFGKGATSEQTSQGVMQGVDALAKVGASTAKIASNLKSVDDLDERGNRLGKKDYLGNISAGVEAGSALGQFGGPMGKLIGGAAGGLIAGGATLFGADDPTVEDMMAKENEFQLGLMMKTIRPEDTFSKQQLMAEDGMNITGTKQIEVERDEIVLRKVGKGYKKVADFKGGKSHMQGGEQYVAEEGDVIIPGKKRGAAQRALKNRRWGAIESMRMQLPTDVGQEAFAKGTSGVNPTPWERAREHVQVAEGGVSTDKTDRGNYTTINGSRRFIGTRFGLTFDTWRLHNKRRKPTTDAEFNTLKAEFNELGKDDAAADFKTHYWDKFQLAKISDPEVAANIFDAAVNQGWTLSTDAKNNVNTALGIDDTENVGATIEAINSAIKEKGADFVNDSIGKQRVLRYKGSKTFKQHGEAWMKNRVKPFLSDKGKESIDNNVAIVPGDITPTQAQDPLLPAPQDKVTTTEGVPEFKDLSVTEQQEALAKDDARAEEIKDLPGFWHRGTTKGQMAQLKKATGKAFIGGVLVPDYLNIESRTIGAIQAIAPGLAKKWGVGPDKYDPNTDEVGFEDTEQGYHLRQQAEKLHKVMEGNTSWWRRTFSELEGVDAIRNKLLTGQSIGAGMPAATGNMMAGLEPEELNTLLTELKNKGEIDDIGVQYAKFIYNNPEQIHTTEMKVGMATDIASLAANPKAILSAAKMGIKAGKIPFKVAVALTKSKNWAKGWKALTKDAPALAKKVGNGIVDALKTDYKYKGGESMDDMLKGVSKVTDDLADSGVKLSKENATWVEKAKSAGQFIKSVPDRIRKAVTGNSLDEINGMRRQVEELTGKGFRDLQKMERSEIDALIKTKWDSKVKGVEDAITSYADARKSHASLGTDLKAAQQELKAVQQGKADPVEIGKIEAHITDIGNKLVAAEIAIEKAQDVSKMHFDEVVRLEGFMDDPLYRDKFRTAVKLQQGVVNQMKKLDQADEGVKSALKGETELMEIMEGLGDAKKSVRQKAISTIDASIEAKTAKQAESLKDVQKAGGEVQAAKGRQAAFEQQAVKFPKIFNAIEKDAEVLRDLRNGTLTWAQAANIAAEKLRDAPDEELSMEIDNLRKQEGDAIKTPDDKTGPSATGAQRPEVTGVQTGVQEGVAQVPTVPITDEIIKPEIKAGEKKTPFDPKIIGGALDTLSSYAPAIYNIARGLESPTKIDRRFITPQTKRYENLSQPQMNAINEAFETAVSNARNLSGGMMSNFRSNTEKAWADKITRRSEVNAMEAGRADKVASENIDTLNRAEQFNQQVAAKADVMDLQSVAATKSFMAQGMQDVANIGSRNKRDRLLKRNQDMMLGLIGSGSDFSFDPSTGGVSLNKAKKVEATVTEDPTQVSPTGIPAVTPIGEQPAKATTSLFPDEDEENKKTLRGLNFGPLTF